MIKKKEHKRKYKPDYIKTVFLLITILILFFIIFNSYTKFEKAEKFKDKVRMSGTSGFQEPLRSSDCNGYNPFNLSGFGVNGDFYYEQIWPLEDFDTASNYPGIPPIYSTGFGLLRYDNNQDDNGDMIIDNNEIEDYFPAKLFLINSDGGLKMPQYWPVNESSPGKEPLEINKTFVLLIYPKEFPNIPGDNPLPTDRLLITARGAHAGAPFREDQNINDNVEMNISTGSRPGRIFLDNGFAIAWLHYRGSSGIEKQENPSYTIPVMGPRADTSLYGYTVPGYNTFEAMEMFGGELNDAVAGARFSMTSYPHPSNQAPEYVIYSGISHGSMVGLHLSRMLDGINRTIASGTIADFRGMLISHEEANQSTAPAIFFKNFTSPTYSQTHAICGDVTRTFYEDRHRSFYCADGGPTSGEEFVSIGTRENDEAKINPCLSPLNSPPLSRNILLFTNVDDPSAPSFVAKEYYQKWSLDTENWEVYCQENPSECTDNLPDDIDIKFFYYTTTEGARLFDMNYTTLNDAHGMLSPSDPFYLGTNLMECFLGIISQSECDYNILIPPENDGIKEAPIYVKVLDENQLPISGANILVRDYLDIGWYTLDPKVGYTDDSGEAIINARVGWQVIEIQKQGYTTIDNQHIYVIEDQGPIDLNNAPNHILEREIYNNSVGFIKGSCLNGEDGTINPCDNTDTDPTNDFDETGIYILQESQQTFPSITIESPLNQTYSTTDIDYNITVNEALSIAFVSIDNNNITLTNDTLLHYYNLSIDHPSLSEGSHEAIFFVNDTLGNSNTESATFTIDIPSLGEGESEGEGGGDGGGSREEENITEEDQENQTLEQRFDINLFENTEYRILSSIEILLITTDNIHEHPFIINQISRDHILFTLDNIQSTFYLNESRIFTLDGIDIQIFLDNIIDGNAVITFKRVSELPLPTKVKGEFINLKKEYFYLYIIIIALIIIIVITLLLTRKRKSILKEKKAKKRI